MSLAKSELIDIQKKALRGGQIILPPVCVTNCGCKYAGEKEDENDPFYGGSSTQDNRSANGSLLVNS